MSGGICAHVGLYRSTGSKRRCRRSSRAYAESGTVRIESQSETVLETRIKGDWLKVAPDDWLENDRPLTFTVERDSGGVEDNVSCEIIFSGHTIDERRVTGPETSATCQYDTWRDAIDY